MAIRGISEKSECYDETNIYGARSLNKLPFWNNTQIFLRDSPITIIIIITISSRKSKTKSGSINHYILHNWMRTSLPNETILFYFSDIFSKNQAVVLLYWLCRNFVCIHFPVDGNFSAWSSWGQCSKTCGGGRQKRTRSCSAPPPSTCGGNCVGDIEEFIDCNTQSCPGKSTYIYIYHNNNNNNNDMIYTGEVKLMLFNNSRIQVVFPVVVLVWGDIIMRKNRRYDIREN